MKCRIYWTMLHAFLTRSTTSGQTLLKEPYKTTLVTVTTKAIYSYLCCIHLEKEAYFVLVPKHIFVITPIKDRRLQNTKGLVLDGKKYFILESTAKGSQVGFPLKYRMHEINAIVEPFSNERIPYKTLEYKI